MNELRSFARAQHVDHAVAGDTACERKHTALAPIDLGKSCSEPLENVRHHHHVLGFRTIGQAPRHAAAHDRIESLERHCSEEWSRNQIP